MFRKTGKSIRLVLNRLSVSIVEIEILKGHERTDEARLKILKEEIEMDGLLMKPIVVDVKTKIVLDGHHRLEALRQLGCLKIPVYYVSYGSKKIGVLSMVKGLEVTKARVVEAALEENLLPPKTTWHYLSASSKTLNHISCIQKRTDIPLTDLF
jgi:ParB-like chromosome segregation protein Spo0J